MALVFLIPVPSQNYVKPDIVLKKQSTVNILPRGGGPRVVDVVGKNR
jgi:hypothetical protein